MTTGGKQRRRRRLHILGKTYSIRYVKCIERAVGDTGEKPGHLDGYLDGQTIWINSSRPVDCQLETLLHEILHIIDPRLQEHRVEDLSPKLFQVLGDNGMVGW